LPTDRIFEVRGTVIPVCPGRWTKKRRGLAKTGNADLGDARRNHRLIRLAARVAQQPGGPSQGEKRSAAERAGGVRLDVEQEGAFGRRCCKPRRLRRQGDARSTSSPSTCRWMGQGVWF
ncbi:MAG: hypothetical protein IPG17_14745, partial [Sandaracinaceae bacterium]|nr:hypothetical protein [Sandaracinaceae bacterium]